MSIEQFMAQQLARPSGASSGAVHTERDMRGPCSAMAAVRVID